jgi:hypothetical protein
MTVEYFFMAAGFLIASLIGIAAIPFVHRRAMRLAAQRLGGGFPQSTANNQADKGRRRAEFAMSIRRLEKTVEQLRNTISNQLVELSKKQDAINQLKIERDTLKIDIAAIKTKVETTALSTKIEEYAKSAPKAVNQSLKQNTWARDKRLSEDKPTLDERLSDERALPIVGHSDKSDIWTHDSHKNDASIVPTIQQALQVRLTRNRQEDKLDECMSEASQIANIRAIKHSRNEDTWDRDNYENDPSLLATEKNFPSASIGNKKLRNAVSR